MESQNCLLYIGGCHIKAQSEDLSCRKSAFCLIHNKTSIYRGPIFVFDNFFYATVNKNTCIYNASWAFQWFVYGGGCLMQTKCIGKMIGNVSDWLS